MASVPEKPNAINSETSNANDTSERPPDNVESENGNIDVPASSNAKVNRSTVDVFPNVEICSPIGMQSSCKPVSRSNRSILKLSSLFTDANVSSPCVTFGNNTNKSVKLKPSVLSNPFVNNEDENQVSNCDDAKNKLPNTEKPDSTNDDLTNSIKSSSTPVFVPLNNPSSSSTNTSAVTSTTNNTATFSVSNNLSVTEITNNTPSSTSVSTEFVFGQNLHERVTMKNENSTEPVTQNGITSSEMLFSLAAKQDSSSTHEFSNGNTKTLSVSAREYEEARSVKRKYEEVAVVTGEEDEQNVLQINCKLYAFDNAATNWSERGRGTLRVNDRETPEGRSSRLIMRLLGNLRVVLNTKIWSEMTVELASKHSVRLTAIDNDGQVRIYLVTANPKDAEHLYNVLSNRIQKKKLKINSEESASKTANDV